MKIVTRKQKINIHKKRKNTRNKKLGGGGGKGEKPGDIQKTHTEIEKMKKTVTNARALAEESRKSMAELVQRQKEVREQLAAKNPAAIKRAAAASKELLLQKVQKLPSPPSSQNLSLKRMSNSEVLQKALELEQLQHIVTKGHR